MNKFIFFITAFFLSSVAFSHEINRFNYQGEIKPTGFMLGKAYLKMNTGTGGINPNKKCKIFQTGSALAKKAIIWSAPFVRSDYCTVEVPPKEFYHVFSGCILNNFNLLNKLQTGDKQGVELIQTADRVFFEWYGDYTQASWLCFLNE